MTMHANEQAYQWQCSAYKRTILMMFARVNKSNDREQGSSHNRMIDLKESIEMMFGKRTITTIEARKLAQPYQSINEIDQK